MLLLQKNHEFVFLTKIMPLLSEEFVQNECINKPNSILSVLKKHTHFRYEEKKKVRSE